MEEQSYEKVVNSFEGIAQHRITKVIIYSALAVTGLYLSGKLMLLLAGVVSSYKVLAKVVNTPTA